MDLSSIQNVIRELSPLELATLVCLIADQHCIVSAPENLLDDLEAELRLFVENTFDLSCVVVNCSPSTTTTDFSNGVVVENEANLGDGVCSPARPRPS